jgi:AMMECR1 domain-containing protein
MAHPAAGKLKEGSGVFFAGSLDRPLRATGRRAVCADVRALLLWQRDFAVWTPPRNRVDAVPFVALYARGKLLGCFGSSEGTPADRLTRAFLRAMNDTRFGGVGEGDRDVLAAEVSYVQGTKAIDPTALEAVFEPGTHGLGVLSERGGPVVLLPGVARDHGYKARAMLDALVKKAGVTDPSSARFFSFETETVVARGGEEREPAPSSGAAAAAWLAHLVQDDGSVLFARDARTGKALVTGEMHHARSAVALQALAADGGYAVKVKRARRRLARDAATALAGGSIVAWPSDPAKVAGTLAHLVRAGIDVRGALLAMASRSEVEAVPWHAGQVAAALGKEAPDSLWRACVRDVGLRPWAPWTLLAATQRDDLGVVDRVTPALIASIRSAPPHRGGAGVTEVPEVALTALTVEALRGVRATREVKVAIARGKEFLERWQVKEACVPAPYDPDASVGAFVGSPISNALRGDVTGHAYLALM